MSNNPDDIYGASSHDPNDIYGSGGDTVPKPNPFSGDVADAFFQHDSFGRILNAFGTGFKQQWGAGSFSEGATKAIARNQSFVEDQKDWSSVHKQVSKTLNTALLRPLYGLGATALDTFNAGMGGAFGAVKEASNQLMEEAASKEPSLVPKSLLGGAGEALGAVAPQTSIDYRNPYTGDIQASTWMLLPEGAALFNAPQKPFMDRATQARAMGHIGEGEEGFFNTVPPNAAELAERKTAAEEAGLPPAALVIRPQEVDPDRVARMIDPDTFSELDRIKDVQENLRLSLQNERAKRQVALQGMPETHPKMVKSAEGIADLQERIQGVDEQLRDMIPVINEVRARADEYMNSESPEGAMFRDFIQSKLLEAELREEADLAVQHADSLMPNKDPIKIAEEQLKVVDRQHQVAEDGAPDVESTDDTGKPSKPATGTAEEAAKVQPQVAEAESAYGVKAPEFQQGTGPARVHGLSADIERRAVESGLVDSLGRLPEYGSLDLKAEADKAVAFKDKDFNEAVLVARGLAEAPEDIHPLAVLEAVRQEAQRRGDVDLILQLANTELRKRVTQAAQDLRILQERDRLDTSAVDRIEDVNAYRKEKNQKAITEDAFKTGEILKGYMEKASSSIDDAISFIRSIECDS